MCQTRQCNMLGAARSAWRGPLIGPRGPTRYADINRLNPPVSRGAINHRYGWFHSYYWGGLWSPLGLRRTRYFLYPLFRDYAMTGRGARQLARHYMALSRSNANTTMRRRSRYLKFRTINSSSEPLCRDYAVTGRGACQQARDSWAHSPRLTPFTPLPYARTYNYEAPIPLPEVPGEH